MKKTILYFIFLFWGYFEIKAQNIPKDSIKTINATQILQIVRQYHPISKQAYINIQKAKADVITSRAGFDPILSLQAGRKVFGGTDYYDYVMPEIRLPTWYGIEVFAGAENLSGERTESTSTLGQTNYFGVSVSLAKNLLMDKRRAFLKQAKIFSSMANTEQRATIIVVKNNVIINEKRLELVKKSVANGERPAIDIVEANTQLQSFLYEQNMQYLAFQNAGLALSSYLWKENNTPYLLPESIVPEDSWETETDINDTSKFNIILNDLLASADKNHPDLQLYTFKLDVLAIDKKLKFQELLPKIDFRYNQLGKGYDILSSSTQFPLFENNFQYGLKLEMPLRLSQGRGEYRKAKLKIEETQLFQNQKRLTIQIKIKSYYNEFLTLRNQITLQTNNYANYQQLVKAEETKFLNGESSIFLINSRENKALEALEKLIELKTKYYKTVYALQWSAGLLQ
jgi:outer membrane protein TolC